MLIPQKLDGRSTVTKCESKTNEKDAKNRGPSKENIDIGNGDEELEQKTNRHKQAQTEQETTLLYLLRVIEIKSCI